MTTSLRRASHRLLRSESSREGATGGDRLRAIDLLPGYRRSRALGAMERAEGWL